MYPVDPLAGIIFIAVLPYLMMLAALIAVTIVAGILMLVDGYYRGR